MVQKFHLMFVRYPLEYGSKNVSLRIRYPRVRTMTERIKRKKERLSRGIVPGMIGFWLIISLLLVACSSDDGEPSNILGAGKGGRQLPPAWTPTPISIPGTGLDVGTWQPCDDAPPSQLEMGDIAMFEGTSLKLRLRGEPSLAGTLAGEINPGDRIEIINGPACSDQLVWWEVKSMSAGNTGWAAEGNTYDTWLVRVDEN
jgi:hypothetical protein